MDSFKQSYNIAPSSDDVPSISATDFSPSYPSNDREGVQTKDPTTSSSTLIKEILETLLFTFFVIWFVKTASQNFRIEGASMQPTLQEGQYLIVNRLSYFLDEPERGDIIVLHFPNDRSRDFIKRIIGLPGDTVKNK